MVITSKHQQPVLDKAQLNKDIADFPRVHAITEDMHIEHKGVSRLVMIDRYSFKDTEKKTLKVTEFVSANQLAQMMNVSVTQIISTCMSLGMFVSINQRLDAETTGLSSVETTEEVRKKSYDRFYEQLSSLNFIPAGRVLYGAGAGTDVTYFNCYVMPFVPDSREGISDHRKQVMEIMSRGGGVGTNGSTLRPRNTLARGVNGKSSGSVSWLDDIAKLTHLVEQGGSRRGAQMIMLAFYT